MNQMQQCFSEMHNIANGISRRTGIDIDVRTTETGRFSFYADKKNFAFGSCRKLGAVIKISTKQEWAIQAGVEDTVDRVSENGWWGKPSVSWNIETSNKKKLKQVEKILARVCVARIR